jgi:hypothetical protein
MPLNFCPTGEVSCCGVNVVDANIKQGETINVQLAFTNPDGSALNITGYSLKMQVNFPTPVLFSTGNGGITITNAAGGLAMLNDTDLHTEAYPVGGYAYDVFTISGGSDSICYMQGIFNVLQSVTPIP